MRARNPSAAYALALQSGAQGRRSRSGHDTEALVERLHYACYSAGVAYVYKRPTPTVGAHGALRFAAKSGADYGGWLLDGSGRAVSVEVKRCSERRLPLSRIEEHQRRELDAADRARAVAVLLVVYGPTLARCTLHAVPWSLVAGMLEDPRGLRALGPEELAPWTVPQGAAYLAQPWLLRRAA